MTTAPAPVRGLSPAGRPASNLSPAAFDWVRELVYREAAIVLEPGKEYLVESRLLPLSRQAGKDSVTAYVEGLRFGRDARESARVVDALTTNETSWFRDGSPFRALQDQLVPEVLASGRPDRTLRIWSAACSSGQEPYTVAMSVSDAVRAAGWRLEILATDISEEMLARAKAGRYSQLEVNRGLPAPLLVKHFHRVGTEWEVAPEFRQSITFRRMNLAAPFGAMPQFDIVLLRNVLIYFDTPTKRSILKRVASSLRPDGHLLLGGAETTLGVDDAWDRVLVSGAPVHRPIAQSGRRGA
ncbi:chemotaxis protein methyltransferase CheR [Motilibacter rhizosphaerae]|uniref:protein-glutamate O-methyltransferase n=1 Tax=Motilibacter rhizosphaerae TaxID=598652 RepID=A0A4V2F530_9ACTN|nr:protein-glutamate O-methyltransferase CheR [Motilibacter rhizosphaerae]RZS91389.1 chemotaxis protein methyltransferase CheR [Motilibacter rhizosphaerae]